MYFPNIKQHINNLVFIIVATLVSLNACAADLDPQNDTVNGFDHKHKVWEDLLHSNVIWTDDGNASRVRYHGFKIQATQFNTYLDSISNVSQQEFNNWTKPQQLAFLINAYNAYTIKLILSKYPDLASIKELGSILTNPWKIKFFTFMGKKTNLDFIEHTLIRKQGAYDEPRIHVAVVCASIGCPALRNEAFLAETLNAQLEDSMVRFLSDKTRNRYNTASGVLEISKIFKWYEGDFVSGYGSLEEFLARYATIFTHQHNVKSSILSFDVDIDFLPYNWDLNSHKD